MRVRVYSRGVEVEPDFYAGDLQRDEVGVFETLRTYNRRVFKADEHLRRLQESVKTSGFGLRFKDGQLRRELRQSTRAFFEKNPNVGDVSIRMTFFQDRLFILIGERRHPKRIYDKGVKLRTSPVRRSLSNASFPETKTSAYQNAVLASLEPQPDAVYEWLMLDKAGFVTEVRVGNIFMVGKKVGTARETPLLLTPSTPGILNGVTRRFVIECALRNKIAVKEAQLTRHDFYNASEVFLTNTSWEILPVSQLDGRQIGSQLPGPITQQLQRTFKKRISKELI